MPEPIPLHLMIHAKWEKPQKVEDFKYPYLSVDFGPASRDGKYLKEGDHAVNIRTLGHHDPAETLVHLYQSCLHHNLRNFVERTVWDALHSIQSSTDYQQAHDAWRKWKGEQPPAEQGKIMKLAQGHPA